MQVGDTFACDLSGSYPLDQDITDAVKEHLAPNPVPSHSDPSQPLSTQPAEPLERESDYGETYKTVDVK